MSAWDMGGTRWDVAGGMCRGTMGSRVQWAAGHGAMLQEAPEHPASPQSPWKARVDMGPVSTGWLLKQNLVPQNICLQLSLSLICAVRVLQPW